MQRPKRTVTPALSRTGIESRRNLAYFERWQTRENDLYAYFRKNQEASIGFATPLLNSTSEFSYFYDIEI